MKLIPNNAPEWIMAFGIVFSLALFFGAVFADDLWEDHSYENAPPITAGMPAPHTDGKEKMACTTCHIIIPPTNGAAKNLPMPIVVGTRSPHNDVRNDQACSNCHTVVGKNQQMAAARAAAQGGPAIVNAALPVPPVDLGLEPNAYETYVPVRFQGKVIKVHPDMSKMTSRNVTILVDNGVTEPIWVDLAPYWFLHAERCKVGRGMFVKGTALRESFSDTKVLAYAKNIAVNGELCTLRNAHLAGYWVPGTTAIVQHH